MEYSDNKILVLCMSCNKEDFLQMENIIKNTWAKEIIDNRIKNMKFFFYTSTDDKEKIDYENHKIYVKSGDEIYNTFDKTKKCIKLINKEGIKYDYIVRVNTSTFINTILLNNYISIMSQLKDRRILCTMIINKDNKLFPCGKVLVFNKEHIDKILNSKYINRKKLPDDEIYGEIFNKGITSYQEIVHIYRVAGLPVYYNWNEQHRFNYDKYEVETVKNSLFSSVRSFYDNRHQECVSMLALYNILSNVKYTHKDILDNFFNDILLVVDNNGMIEICK